MIKKYKQGFIALTVVLSVTSILLALVFSSVIEQGLFFDQAVKKKYRAMNYYFAYNCLDQAILMLAHDYFLTVSQSLKLPDLNCSIISIKAIGNIRTILTRGDFQKVYVFRSGTVLLHDNSLEVVKIE